MKRFVKFTALLLSLLILSTQFYGLNADTSAAAITPFSDVPSSSGYYKAVNDLRSLGVTGGIGDNKFGAGKALTRGEFVTWLVRLAGWELEAPEKGSYSDNLDKTKFYFKPVETALKHGLIQKADNFRPEAGMTRLELAAMLVRYLGYDDLAAKLVSLGKPYEDVTGNAGHIGIIKDLGLMDAYAGADGVHFKPAESVLREQAALSLMGAYEKLQTPITFLNAFYAISSNSQRDKINSLSSACFGWSRLTYDVKTGQVLFNMAHDGTTHDEYYLPDGFSERVSMAKDAGIPAMLSVFATQDVKVPGTAAGTSVGMVEYVLTTPGEDDKLIAAIADHLKLTSNTAESSSFDGVVIDFEGLRGNILKEAFNAFLKKLETQLTADGKKLYIAVPPLIAPARSSASIDGYDYKTIGSLADKVILMAHDYNAKTLTDSDMARGVSDTPLTPVEDVYYALKAITDKTTGVQDRSKIMLQISFGWYGWQEKDGKTLNRRPDNYSYDGFMNIINGPSSTVNWSQNSRNPYLKFTDAATGIENTIWYEDSRSVQEKMNLAEFFGITDISLWRLGLIADREPVPGSKAVYMDVWQTILSEMGKN